MNHAIINTASGAFLQNPAGNMSSQMPLKTINRLLMSVNDLMVFLIQQIQTDRIKEDEIDKLTIIKEIDILIKKLCVGNKKLRTILSLSISNINKHNKQILNNHYNLKV